MPLGTKRPLGPDLTWTIRRKLPEGYLARAIFGGFRFTARGPRIFSSLLFLPLYVRKLFGKQFLDVRQGEAQTTYWNDLPQEEVNPELYKHQF